MQIVKTLTEDNRKKQIQAEREKFSKQIAICKISISLHLKKIKYILKTLKFINLQRSPTYD